MTRRLRWAVGLVVALAITADLAAQDDSLRYVVRGDAIVFTNVPTPGSRPVPGMSTEDVPAGKPAAKSSPDLPLTIYDGYIDEVAAEFDLSPALIKSVALVESGFDPHAVSKAGAKGLMQLMPATALEYGVTDAFDPLANLRAGSQHLRMLLDQFDGNLTLALAAYNAGAGAVRRHNGVPAYAETVDYVRKVHERLGRRPDGLPGEPRVRPVGFRVLSDGTVMISN